MTLITLIISIQHNIYMWSSVQWNCLKLIVIVSENELPDIMARCLNAYSVLRIQSEELGGFWKSDKVVNVCTSTLPTLPTYTLDTKGFMMATLKTELHA